MSSWTEVIQVFSLEPGESYPVTHLKKQYRALARSTHPDMVGDSSRDVTFSQVQLCWEFIEQHLSEGVLNVVFLEENTQIHSSQYDTVGLLGDVVVPYTWAPLQVYVQRLEEVA